MRNGMNALARKYGNGCDEHLFEQMMDARHGACQACGLSEVDKALSVDHDHCTGQVRGLLCSRCNQVLGRCNDDASLLRKFAEYLVNARARYSDHCTQCRLTDSRFNVCHPIEIVSTDGTYTRFAYHCDRGHKWECGWLTKGILPI